MKVSTIVATGARSLSPPWASPLRPSATHKSPRSSSPPIRWTPTAGKLAASTSKNAQVKAFAQRMVTDHTNGSHVGQP